MPHGSIKRGVAAAMDSFAAASAKDCWMASSTCSSVVLLASFGCGSDILFVAGAAAEIVGGNDDAAAHTADTWSASDLVGKFASPFHFYRCLHWVGCGDGCCIDEHMLIYKLVR